MVALVHRGRIGMSVEVADLVTVVGALCVAAHVGSRAALRVDGDGHGLLVIGPVRTVVAVAAGSPVTAADGGIDRIDACGRLRPMQATSTRAWTGAATSTGLTRPSSVASHPRCNSGTDVGS